MAYTYPNTPVLSKIKIGNDYYYLKDADVRTIINGFNDDIVKGQLGLVTEENKLVYSQNIKSYVDAEVAKVKQFSYEVVSELPTPSADTMFIIYLVPKGAGKTGYLEYLCIDKGAEASPRYVFEEIGDTDVDLSGYVTNVSYLNGTLSQTKGDGQTTTVHTFGPFVDASQASGTVAGQTISGVKATGNVSGTAAITTTSANATVTKGAYTPEGTIIVNGTSNTAAQVVTSGNVTAGTDVVYTQGSLPSKAADTFDGGELPSINYEAFNGGSVDVSYVKGTGSVSLASDANVNLTIDFEPGSFPTFTQGSDTFDAGTLPTKASDTFTANTPTVIDTTKFSGGSKASDTFTQGTLPSKAADTFTAGSLGAATKATFATEGIVATVGESGTADEETLIFTTATPASAVTEQGTFTAPTFSEGAFNAGTLPTFTEGAFTQATIQTGFYTPGTAATFSEGAFTQGTLPTFEQGTDSYIGGAFPTIDQSETYGTLTSLNLNLTAPELSVDFQAATINSATFFDEGALPTFTEGAFNAGSLPTLTGGKATVVTLPTFSEVTVLTNVAPTFSGTEVSDALVTNVAYDKVDASATVTASNVELSVGDIAVASKSVTVTPDVSE